jgi:hypothetical protein
MAYLFIIIIIPGVVKEYTSIKIYQERYKVLFLMFLGFPANRRPSYPEETPDHGATPYYSRANAVWVCRAQRSENPTAGYWSLNQHLLGTILVQCGTTPCRSTAQHSTLPYITASSRKEAGPGGFT